MAQLWIVAVICMAVSWAIEEYWADAGKYAFAIYLIGFAFAIAGFVYFLDRRLFVTKLPVER